MGSFFKKLEEKAQERKRAREQEKMRLRKIAEEEAQRQREDMENYARWYRQGIDAFLEEIKAKGFSLSGGFETCPFIDYDKPLLSHITKEGDVSILDFPDVRGVALDQNSRQMMLYEVYGKKRAEYLSGAVDPGKLVSYKLINYDRVIGAEYIPHYKYDTKYDDSDAMASAMAGGIIDGIFGGRAGAYMAFSSASEPVAVTNEIQTGVTLVIKTREPGYERIVFRASRFKAGDDPTFGAGCNPITDTIFRQACAGVFSKVPYHVKEKIISRSNGTKKDFWLGLGIYVEPYKIEGRGDIEEAFAPCAQLGAVDYYFEKCAEEINQCILNGLITPWGVLGAELLVFQPEDSGGMFGGDSSDALLSDNNDAEDVGDWDFVPEEQPSTESDPADFTTKRAYEVASWLVWVQERNSDRPMDEYELLCTERCEFIRDNPDLLAAKYLTCEGEYLYAQAVKEHFSLPFDVEEEDDTSKTNLGELIMDTIEFDVDLALEIWFWCIREFYPHQHYCAWPGDVVTCMEDHLVDCPDVFLQKLISCGAEDELLCAALMTVSEECSFFAMYLTSVALRNGDGQTAEKLFSTYICGDYAKDKNVYGVLEGIISECTNWDEKESLELFRDWILPVAAKHPKHARVFNGMKKWTKQVDEHIEEVERSVEKYAYSGRYAWRTAFTDRAEYSLDPRNYETKEEYLEQINERKNWWRRKRAAIAATYELDVNEYETQEEFECALGERIAQARKKRQQQRDIERRKCERAQRKPDPLAAIDKTVYYFCGVVFLNSEAVYRYRMQDTSLSIGDLVVAPIGKEKEPLVAKIVSIEQHTRKSAPLLVDEAQFIVGPYVPEEAGEVTHEG